MLTAALIPAYEAETTIGGIVEGLLSCWPNPIRGSVIVVDDGSHDETSRMARQAGALVVHHGINRGKGEALRTGLRVAGELGFDTVVTLDADGQHPPEQARLLALHEASPSALVLGVRNLRKAGAPRPNRFSNGISNLFLSAFTSKELHDTQCGLRRYPVRETLDLDTRSSGYAFEAEVILLACSAGFDVVQVPVDVVYDGPRVSHFHPARDPGRIIARVLWTLGREKMERKPSPWRRTRT